MNRRRFLSILAGAGGILVLPTKELLATTPALHDETDHAAIIKNFVESKVRAGYSDLFLFKNRSGQFAFQIYDPKSGHPTLNEAVYLLYGKPDPNHKGGDKLPLHGQVIKVCGMPCAGVEFDWRSDPRKLRADLDSVFRKLTA